MACPAWWLRRPTPTARRFPDRYPSVRPSAPWSPTRRRSGACSTCSTPNAPARDLKPLVADDALREVARRHSLEMFQRDYFSHTSPTTGSPFDRMRAASILFVVAGENLAFAPNVDIAHRGLMNSPGHRANILRPEFGRIGIGAIRSPGAGQHVQPGVHQLTNVFGVRDGLRDEPTSAMKPITTARMTM